MAAVLFVPVVNTSAEEELVRLTMQGVKLCSTINQMKLPELITGQLLASVSGYGQPFHNI